MAFNKVFIILALAACTLAMPVHQVDQTTESVKVETTPGSIEVEGSTGVQESTTKVEIADEDETTIVDDSTAKILAHEELVDQEIVKRSVEEEASASADADDLETAAGTNVLRPLFVYRQQVAYRQRIRNANRRGNRRF